MPKFKNQQMQTGFVHTVFFWLKEPDNQEAQEALKAGLKELEKIDLIQAAYTGVPGDTKREVIDSSYSFGITFIFKNKADHDIYQDHADHHVFIKNCSHLWSKVQVYDLASF